MSASTINPAPSTPPPIAAILVILSAAFSGPFSAYTLVKTAAAYLTSYGWQGFLYEASIMALANLALAVVYDRHLKSAMETKAAPPSNILSINPNAYMIAAPVVAACSFAPVLAYLYGPIEPNNPLASHFATIFTANAVLIIAAIAWLTSQSTKNNKAPSAATLALTIYAAISSTAVTALMQSALGNIGLAYAADIAYILVTMALVTTLMAMCLSALVQILSLRKE